MVALQRRKLIPHLIVPDIIQAVDFYKQALGAEEVVRSVTECEGQLVCAELRIGLAVFHVCEVLPDSNLGPEWGNSSQVSVTLHLEVQNCDAALVRAVAAGAEVIFPPQDMFWGDRYARIRDPFGHEWSFSHSSTQQQRFAA
jgi:PhnB protein